MNATQAMVRGWCPGALRPMESGDGLIVRLKITGGIVSTRLASDIALWSARWGNGQIDLTARANLQLRGMRLETLPDLQDAIAACGLLDSSPEAEAVRNVIASPLAGLDPEAIIDIRPLVRNLEHRLTGDPALHALPAKFGFAIDDGGRLGLGDAPADIGFEARRSADGPAFDIRLDGAPAYRLGPCAPADVPSAAAILCRAFIAASRSSPDIRRMRDCVRVAGVDEIADVAGLAVVPSSATRATPASAYIGRHALGANIFVGIGLPFGRIAALDLANLVAEIERLGGDELRLTPWRTILVPCGSTQNASPLEGEVGDATASTCGGFRAAARQDSGAMREDRGRGRRYPPPGNQSVADLPLKGGGETRLSPLGRGEARFILCSDDPLRRVAACVGAPVCARATTDIRADATRLANIMPRIGMLHVSGCAKGCAHPKPAAITLVGRGGRYDLIRDGAPSDRPEAAGLSIAQAERLIALGRAEP
jgi:precorrin-3B synthase